ncbi:MAG: tRNA lysidine(34) synthetase TilS [Lachnospiraceae bacterium]|nr:tRNA lysidine(34) synthetase TilS [Lachnospiraceae bacterium]
MLPDRVKKTIYEYDMIRPGDRIVAGVSGGADSVCLFHILRMLREEIGFSLCIVHVHHMIRGEEADRDEAFVRNLCREYDVPCVVRKMNVPAYAAENGMSVEEAGRVLRRDAFARIASEKDGSKIALAHHMNDVAETVLFNMARGSGIAGLASLRPVRGEYIRPLLGLERREIETWLREKKFSYCDDSTNADSTYSRNRIRHSILPELSKHVNAQSVRHICEISEEAGLIEELLDAYVDRCYAKYVQEGSGECVIGKELFEEGKAVIAGRVVRLTMGHLAGTVKDIGRVHIRSVCELSKKENGKMVILPYGMCAESVYGEVHIRLRGTDIIPLNSAKNSDLRSADYPDRQSTSAVARKYDEQSKPECSPDGGSECVALVPETGKTAEFGKYLVTAVLSDAEGSDMDIGKTENMYTKKFDYDKINGILKIRYRMAGDYLVINPDGRRKSLSDFFTDRKIPRNERDRILLLTCGAEVLWVIGLRSGESCRIDTMTKTVLTVTVEQYGG